LVSRQDLTDLFMRHRPRWTGAEREARIQEVLGTRDGVPMNDAEDKLKDIFRKRDDS